ncbi:MAG TPA: transporter [Bryobacteraceae bacterium]|nr:transporter [Bryobacteraceae bacterium]
MSVTSNLYAFARSLFWVLSASAIISPLAQGQYLGLNLLGDTGLKSGSQPIPGFYLMAPLYYRNDYTGLRGPQGNEVLSNLDVNINLFTVPAIAGTTKAKFLGATYGFQIVPMVMNTRLDVAALGYETSDGYGFGDMYVQPINLGWRTKRADFLGAYGVYIPTGQGGRSLDMWAHEIVAGTTVYLDQTKKWHVATTGFYEIHQNKRGIDLRVGDILTLEGGAGRSFMKGMGNAGLAYVAQWKVTDDTGTDFPERLPKSKNRAFGLGPDISMPVFAKGTTIGIVGFRFIREFGARTNFEGSSMVLSFTLAKLNL